MQQGAPLFRRARIQFRQPRRQARAGFHDGADQRDFSAKNLDYGGARSSFLKGEGGILVDGTWMVGQFDAASARPERPLYRGYAVRPFPSVPGAQRPSLVDGHNWVMPRDRAAHRSRTRGRAAVPGASSPPTISSGPAPAISRPTVGSSTARSGSSCRIAGISRRSRRSATPLPRLSGANRPSSSSSAKRPRRPSPEQSRSARRSPTCSGAPTRSSRVSEHRREYPCNRPACAVRTMRRACGTR